MEKIIDKKENVWYHMLGKLHKQKQYSGKHTKHKVKTLTKLAKWSPIATRMKETEECITIKWWYKGKEHKKYTEMFEGLAWVQVREFMAVYANTLARSSEGQVLWKEVGNNNEVYETKVHEKDEFTYFAIGKSTAFNGIVRAYDQTEAVRQSLTELNRITKGHKDYYKLEVLNPFTNNTEVLIGKHYRE